MFLKCSICGNYYRKKKELDRHFFIEHSAEKLHERARLYKKQQKVKEKIEEYKKNFNYNFSM